VTAPREGLALIDGYIPFGSAVGLEAITLQVARGERLVLVGPSGAGKTSLLRAMAGLGPMLAGRVLVDGQDMTLAPPEARGIVYMHQTPSLFPHLSVVDNIAFPLEVRGMARRTAREESRALLERVQLREFANRRPDSLSGGQRHRVALARALAARPAALLLDEPFSSLDPSLRSDVRDSVLDLLGDRSGPAVALVTHDVDEAAIVGDRIAILLNGRIVQVGSPAEILGTPRSVAVARFLGLTNVMPGRRDGSGLIESPAGRFLAPGPAGPVAVVCRPGALRVRPSPVGDPATIGVVAAVVERVTGRMVSVRAGDQELMAMPDESQIAVGTPVTCDIEPGAMHVFASSGQGD
jgi:ABC-type Fe3+/spermidine/putrescine transport system ATPase subunit